MLSLVGRRVLIRVYKHGCDVLDSPVNEFLKSIL